MGKKTEKQKWREKLVKDTEAFLNGGGKIQVFNNYGEWVDAKRDYTVNFEKLERRRTILENKLGADIGVFPAKSKGNVQGTPLPGDAVEGGEAEESLSE
jgi:hypothetical protein